MSIALIIFVWAATVVILAGRGRKAWWLGGLVAFPLICIVLLALDPSLRGPNAPAYLPIAAAVAGLMWGLTALASVAAWFIGAHSRRAAAPDHETR